LIGRRYMGKKESSTPLRERRKGHNVFAQKVINIQK